MSEFQRQKMQLNQKQHDAQPFVSIITPVFNRVSFLEACIDSVLAQDIPDFELILIDDCSTENTHEILDRYAQQYPDQIFCRFLETNGGPSAARNVALGIARGKYITFLDSDDRLADGFLQKAKLLAKDNAADMLVFDFDVVNLNNELVVHGKSVFVKGVVDHVGLYTNPNIARLYRRDILEWYSIRYPEKKLCEDALWSLMTNLACEQIVAVPDLGYLVTDHGGSLSRDRGFYAKLSARLLPLAEFSQMHQTFSKEGECGELFDYFCATFAALCCFLWSRRGSAADLKKVVQSLRETQRRIWRTKNRYLRLSAFRSQSFRQNVRRVQHWMTVLALWLFRLHLIYPAALANNLIARLIHGDFLRKQSEEKK